MPRIFKLSSGSNRVALTSGRAAKGGRVLGLYVNQSESEGSDYTTAFETAAGALGLQSTTLARNWNDIEATPETYSDPFLGIANVFYPAYGCKLDLILRPVNTNHVEVPPDLADPDWDDPATIGRFEDLLDYVFSQIPDVTLNSVAVGNEVDVLFGEDEALYTSYRAFFEAARDRILSLRPGTTVGVVAQLAGLVGDSDAATYLQALNTEADAIIATYYPVDGNFQVRSPDAAYDDFAALAAAYPGRPAVFTEVGYPSGVACGSSEAMQAAFFSALFSAWDDHRDQIASVTQSWLTDLPTSQVDDLATYYGHPDPAFKAFLRTLGLRAWPGAGATKPAWATFAAEAAARGW